MTATKEEEEENGSSFSSVELETKEKKEEELEDKEGNEEEEEEEEEGNYFGKLAKEGKAPPGTNPFAFSSAVVDDAEEETKKMIEEAKKQTEKQREQREKVEREEREKERLAAENRGLEFTPRTKAGGETTTTTKKEVVRRKVVRAKRPTPKSDAEDDDGLGKTKPNPFASLVPGGAKKADESKGQKEDAPHTTTSAQQKGNVFSRLSKKGGDDEKKTTTAAAEKKTPRRDPESRRKEKQPRQEKPTPTTAEQQPGLALFPGLAKFKDADDETKKPPPPKGGAGVFSGFSGFAPKPPSKAAEQEQPSSSLFKPSLFAKELGVTCTPEEIRPVTCARASAFAKDIL